MSAYLDIRNAIGFLRSCVRSGERLTADDDDRIDAALDRLREAEAATPAAEPGLDVLIEDTFGPDEKQAIESPRDYERRMIQKGGARVLTTRAAPPAAPAAEPGLGYTVWDLDSGNAVGFYSTLAEASHRLVAVALANPNAPDDFVIVAESLEAATPAAEPGLPHRHKYGLMPVWLADGSAVDSWWWCTDHPTGEWAKIEDDPDAAGSIPSWATPAAEPGLDVQRLARAIAATKDKWFGGDRDSWWLAEPEGMAADIAAEYLRVSASEEERR